MGEHVGGLATVRHDVSASVGLAVEHRVGSSFYNVVRLVQPKWNIISINDISQLTRVTGSIFYGNK